METNDNLVAMEVRKALIAAGLIKADDVVSQQAQQSVAVTKLPIGVIGTDYDGVFMAKSVNELTTWDNYVRAEDGGTYKGMKIRYIETVEVERRRSDYKKKTNSQIKGNYMAVFYVAVPDGRNAPSQTINVYVNDEYNYKVYLDPKKWSLEVVEITMKSKNADEKDRTVHTKTLYFNGTPVTDSLEKVCSWLMKQEPWSKLDYLPYVNGEVVEFI